jgi:muramoyltetrapeptide carboxypeptidase
MAGAGVIGVIAPAGPASAEQVALVPALYARHGLQARLFPSCHARHPRHEFLAGDDALRLADLHAAYADPAIGAIHCLRGGYGCARLLPHVDRALLAANPKPLIGYSDITALHALLFGLGRVGLHAPMPTRCSRCCARAGWLAPCWRRRCRRRRCAPCPATPAAVWSAVT